jgi:hypothetical protein
MLVDFGLVKIFNPQMQTTVGARAVTPGYAPPEQYGKGNTDARTDTYALGATLYNLLTGREPLESVQRMIGKQMPSASQANPQVPVGVSRAIERAMRLDPAERFQSASEFKGAFSASVGPAVVRPVGETYVRPAVQASAARPQAIPGVASAPKKGGSRMSIIIWIVVAAIILICLGFFGVTSLAVISERRLYAQETSDAELQETVSARTRLTSTARAEATSAAMLEATSTALASQSTLVFGPSSGSLAHDPASEQIAATNASVNLMDFIAEATFYNPYSTQTGTWDYGFVLRHEKANVQFRFIVTSSKTWEFSNHTGTPEGEIIQSGEIPGLDVSENGSNHIKLVFQGNSGSFYLNDVFISDLDLSSRMNAGDVFIATGFYKLDQVEGSKTDYQDFMIWSLP